MNSKTKPAHTPGRTVKDVQKDAERPLWRPLWLVTVTFKDGGWAVYKDGQRISAYFKKGREALTHAIRQGWQVGYRGMTYNDGGYLNGIRAAIAKATEGK